MSKDGLERGKTQWCIGGGKRSLRPTTSYKMFQFQGLMTLSTLWLMIVQTTENSDKLGLMMSTGAEKTSSDYLENRCVTHTISKCTLDRKVIIRIMFLALISSLWCWHQPPIPVFVGWTLINLIWQITDKTHRWNIHIIIAHWWKPL